MPYQPKSEGSIAKFGKGGAQHSTSSDPVTRSPKAPKDIKSTLKMPGAKGGVAQGVRMPRRPEK